MKVGLIGCGAIGRQIAEAIDKEIHQFKLLLIYDKEKAKIDSLMRNLNIVMKAPGGGKDFTDQLKAAGYVDDNDYFGRNSTLAKMDMAKELKVSYSSLCAHYQGWEDQFRAAKK